MKNFSLEHPAFFSFILFLTIFIGGSIAGAIFGVLMIGKCEPRSLADPCDAGSMGATFLWIASFIASFIIGIISAIKTFFTLKVKAILN
jgi:hypothetical protein